MSVTVNGTTMGAAPIGMCNQGKSCYFNAVLQALASCDSLIRQILCEKHAQKCPIPKGACLQCSVEEMVVILRCGLLSNQASDAGRYLLEKIHWYCSEFHPHRESDAHELLGFVLQYMSNESGKGIHMGSVEARVTCESCGGRSLIEEPTAGLSLPIPCRDAHHNSPDGAPLDLVCMLEAFHRTERLDTDAMYCCSNCKAKTTAVKDTAFVVLPTLWCIQLKRFVFEQQESRKISQHVSFPLMLDYSGLGASSGAKRRFTLSSVVVHHGPDATSGHYNAFVRRSDDRWFLVNDSCVQPAAVEDVLRCCAYLLLYEAQAEGQGETEARGGGKSDTELCEVFPINVSTAPPPICVIELDGDQSESLLASPAILEAAGSAGADVLGRWKWRQNGATPQPESGWGGRAGWWNALRPVTSSIASAFNPRKRRRVEVSGADDNAKRRPVDSTAPIFPSDQAAPAASAAPAAPVPAAAPPTVNAEHTPPLTIISEAMRAKDHAGRTSAPVHLMRAALKRITGILSDGLYAPPPPPPKRLSHRQHWA